ncbi:hypothetical protein SLEP1_g16854 [Rubroshorea leprosula]|uniref:Cytochrome P450 n=1 Tax=Rubroshorea leprosula TaxID=152421 RepID=A0AAV5J1F5_9ROSI|nr:hypothetical protein SLEP1_g16854 [Rubroshorea leprosula]
MDLSLLFPPQYSMFAILGFPLLLFSFLWISNNLFKNKKREVPQAGGAWPLIGHLHLLGGSQPLYITLGNMADKYGPIFTIKFGSHKVLVVNNSEIAKECLTINDKAFASRPKFVFTELLGYDRSMFGFAPYGPYWRQVRKIATLQLLSNYRLEMFRHARESTIYASLQELYGLWKKQRDSSDKASVDMKKWFTDAIRNVMAKIIVGKQPNSSDAESERWIRLLKEFMELSGRFVLGDALPFLRWLDIGGDEKTMKKTAAELDQVVEEWLQEHKHRRISDETKSDEDFMDAMLSVLGVDNEQLADITIKATCLGLTLASVETSAVTLMWALSLLLNNRHALKKLQHEIDTIVGEERKVNESDLKNLDYLQAIIKETMRLYPAAPLLLPHQSTEDCIVSGYNIPAGIVMFINLPKIQRDSSIWMDPDEFQPERFLVSNKEVDVKGKNFELIPFGSGRRICPGINLALQVMQLTLANLVHGFEISTLLDQPVDMQAGVGLTNSKAAPLEVLIIPRLPAGAY